MCQFISHGEENRTALEGLGGVKILQSYASGGYIQAIHVNSPRTS